MKTFLLLISTIFTAAVFIPMFVFAASYAQIISSEYFTDHYAYAILILDFALFGIIMVGMLYTMNVFERLIDHYPRVDYH